MRAKTKQLGYLARIHKKCPSWSVLLNRANLIPWSLDRKLANNHNGLEPQISSVTQQGSVEATVWLTWVLWPFIHSQNNPMREDVLTGSISQMKSGGSNKLRCRKPTWRNLAWNKRCVYSLWHVGSTWKCWVCPIGNRDAKFDFSCKAEVSCKITFPQDQLEAELEHEETAEGIFLSDNEKVFSALTMSVDCVTKDFYQKWETSFE